MTAAGTGASGDGLAAGDGLEVSGGAGGVAVETAAVRARAALLRSVDADLLALAPAVAGLALDPALAVAGILDPAGAARVQGQVVAALAGPDGLLPAAARAAQLAVSLEVTAAGYELAETSAREAVDRAWDHAAGTVVAFGGWAVGGSGAVALSGAAVAAVGAWVTYRAGGALLDGVRDAAGDAGRGDLDPGTLGERAGRVGDDLRSALGADVRAAARGALAGAARHPWLAEQLLTTHLDVLAQVSVAGRAAWDLAAPAAGLPPAPRDPEGAAAWLAAGSTALGTVRQGPVGVRRVGPATAVRGPTGVADLFARLAPATAHHPGHPPVPRAAGPYRQGVVRLERTAPAGGGPAAWTVYVPPTQTWSTAGGRNPFDGSSNLVGFSGARADAGDAVLQALRAARVASDEPVLLVGYSQGGITAAQLAGDAAVRREFDVAAVLTVGSPVALADVPPTVGMLSVQHEQDLVTVLDGGPNPDTPARTTVSRDLLDPRTGDPAVAAGLAASPFLPHGYAAYAETARRVDAAGDESLVAWRRTVAPFLAGPGTTTTATQWQAARR